MNSSRTAKLKLSETSKDKVLDLHSLFSVVISTDFMREIKRDIYEKKHTQVHIYDMDVLHAWKLKNIDVTSYPFTTLDFLFRLPVVQLVFHFNTSDATAYQPDQVEPRIVELFENFCTYVLPYYEKLPGAKPLITCKFDTSVGKQVEYQNIFKLSSLEAVDESEGELFGFDETTLPEEFKKDEQLLNTAYTIELAKKYFAFKFYMEALSQLLIAYNRLITIHEHDKFYFIPAFKKEVPEMFIEICQRFKKSSNINQFLKSRDIVDIFSRLMDKPNGTGYSYPKLKEQIALIRDAIFEQISVLKKSQRTHSPVPAESSATDTPPLDHKKSSSPFLSQTKFRITPPMDRKETPEKSARKDDIVAQVIQRTKFV